MKRELLERLEAGRTLAEIRDVLDGMEIGGRRLRVTVDPRALPWVDHRIVAHVDGPPSSNVLAVLCAEAPGGGEWRRFTLTYAGEDHLEIAAFPTPFSNPEAPLAPGVPPGGRPAA